MVWVGLDEVVVAGVGVGRGERAGGDHGEVQVQHVYHPNFNKIFM